MSNHDRIWKMLSKRHVEVPASLCPQMSCGICGNLLNNAHNGPCECTFCKLCIDTYLAEGAKYCPGGMEKCKEKKLVINKNVVRNDKVNSLVAKAVVKCPSYQCDHESKLIKMCDHVKVCDREEICCPFGDFGCGEVMKRKKITAHLQSEIYKHNKLVLRWKMDNENILKEDLESNLRKASEQMEEHISQLSVTVADDMKKHKDEIAALLKDLAEVKDQNKELATIITRLENRLDTQSLEISALKRSTPLEREEIFNICEKQGVEKFRRNSIQVTGLKVSKGRSSTFNNGHSEQFNGSDREWGKKKSKTFISGNAESSSFKKKGDKKWSEFIHSFN